MLGPVPAAPSGEQIEELTVSPNPVVARSPAQYVCGMPNQQQKGGSNKK